MNLSIPSPTQANYPCLIEPPPDSVNPQKAAVTAVGRDLHDEQLELDEGVDYFSAQGALDALKLRERAA
ncbi:MAG: hypothetical protein H0X13_19845 [Ramlibacter sp.]|nr:hypothetical protein [Ramlibacter sp.]